MGMNNGPVSLQNRVTDLEHIIHEQVEIIADYKARLSQFEIRNRQLEEFVRLLRANQFAPQSEKSRYVNVDQQELQFDEIETLSETEVPEEEPTPVHAHTRKKKGGGRQPLPDDLPREHVVLDIDESE